MPQLSNPNYAWQMNVNAAPETTPQSNQTPSSAIPVAPMTQQSQPPYTTNVPQYPPIPDLNSINSQLNSSYTPTSQEQKQSDLSTRLQDINQQLTGESAFKTQQAQQYGLLNTTDANGNTVYQDPELKDLNTKLTFLMNQAKAIPLQLQQNTAGHLVDSGAFNNIETGALRNNAIQALQVSSTIAAKQGMLQTAEMYINQAVTQKFGPLEAEQKALTANIALIKNDPTTTLQEKQRADQQASLIQQRTDAIALEKQNYEDAQKQALQYASVASAQQLSQLQQGTSAVDVATKAAQMGLATPEQQKVLADLAIAKANIANLPLEKQLKAAQVLEAQASARLKNAQAAAMSNPPNPTTGLIAGTTGSSMIDSTLNGYYSTPVAGGLTQASIDQKALLYVTSGTLPPQGRTGIAGVQNMAISNRMAELGNNSNLAANRSQLKSLSSSLDQQQKYHDTTQRAFETANENLSALTDYMTSAGINQDSQIPLVNSISNAISRNALDPGALAGYKSAIQGLRTEYAQVLSRGGEVTDSARSQANSLIPDNLTPAQLQQVAERLNVESNNAIGAAQKQIDTIHGQINSILTPASDTKPQVVPPEQIPVGYYQASNGLFYKK